MTPVCYIAAIYPGLQFTFTIVTFPPNCLVTPVVVVQAFWFLLSRHHLCGIQYFDAYARFTADCV